MSPGDPSFHPSLVPPQRPPPDEPMGARVLMGISGSIVPASGTTQITVCGPLLSFSSEAWALIRVDANNNQVANTGGVILDRLACLGSDGNYHTLQIAEMQVCIDNGDGTFTKKKAKVLISDFY